MKADVLFVGTQLFSRKRQKRARFMDGALDSVDVSPLLKFLAMRLVATASIDKKIPSLFLIWSMCGLVIFSSSIFYFGTDQISIDYHNFLA